ncbi:leukosialin [Hippopotamus amphibius kiboko]|uniref:leukosialin n=1 Tax=Hippopotamus amphibius kiboko TaxID=575201 RepID=UPI0025923A10|nr:leukosialin [Hippopotamus amphibius kiboko]
MPALCPYQVSWSQVLLMPVALEMILFLFLFGGVWAQNTASDFREYTTTLQMLESTTSSVSLVSNIYKTTKFNSVTSSLTTTKVPKMGDSTDHETFQPSSTPYTTNEVSSPGTSTAAVRDLPAKTSPMPLETLAATNMAAAPVSTGFHTTTGETIATNPLETSDETSGPPVTMAASSLETSSGTSGPPVTMAASSLETSSGTSGPPVTMAASSLETSSGTSGPPVTMAASSLETSDGTSGPPVTMAASSVETSDGTSGLPITTATSSLKTSKGTSELPVTMTTTSLKTPMGTSDSHTSRVTISSPKPPTNITSSSLLNSGQEMRGTLLVAVPVALLALIILTVLLLLWCQRRKRKTGVLTLSRGGKHNGVADAWAGVAQVSDEEAAATAEGASRAHNDSGVPQGEGSGPRPTLTTFFGRRKSRQGSVAMEELKAGAAPSLKGEEEPLVGSEEEAVEASASDGPEVRDVEAP